eukprot:TRINITY_DN24784_c1_g1_i1.p1 TRINITY_DN24784_c1_g1~~TRINITY_DN24784_c1_g1_i1.p1  ORF type:complete len:2483 (+),score=667.97 TRINITY_DN24784_c1_g1_i1:1008-7451(+)
MDAAVFAARPDALESAGLGAALAGKVRERLNDTLPSTAAPGLSSGRRPSIAVAARRASTIPVQCGTLTVLAAAARFEALAAGGIQALNPRLEVVLRLAALEAEAEEEEEGLKDGSDDVRGKLRREWFSSAGDGPAPTLQLPKMLSERRSQWKRQKLAVLSAGSWGKSGMSWGRGSPRVSPASRDPKTVLTRMQYPQLQKLARVLRRLLRTGDSDVPFGGGISAPFVGCPIPLLMDYVRDEVSARAQPAHTPLTVPTEPCSPLSRVLTPSSPAVRSPTPSSGPGLSPSTVPVELEAQRVVAAERHAAGLAAADGTRLRAEDSVPSNWAALQTTLEEAVSLAAASAPPPLPQPGQPPAAPVEAEAAIQSALQVAAARINSRLTGEGEPQGLQRQQSGTVEERPAKRTVKDIIEWTFAFPSAWLAAFPRIEDPFVEADFVEMEPRVEFGLQMYPFIGEWDVRFSGVLHDLSRVLDRLAGQIRARRKRYAAGARHRTRAEADCAQWLDALQCLPPREAVQGVGAAFLYSYEIVGEKGTPRSRQICTTLSQVMATCCDPVRKAELSPPDARVQGRMLTLFHALVWSIDAFAASMRGTGTRFLYRAVGVRVSKRHRIGDAVPWCAPACASLLRKGAPEQTLRRSGGGTLFVVRARSGVDVSPVSFVHGEDCVVLPSCRVLRVAAKLPESLLAMLMTNSDVVVMAEFTPGQGSGDAVMGVDLRLSALRESRPVFDEFLHSFIEPRIARVPVSHQSAEASDVQRLYPAFDRWRASARPPPILLLAAGGMGKTTMTLALMGNMLREVDHMRDLAQEDSVLAGKGETQQEDGDDQLPLWVSMPSVGRAVLRENETESALFSQLHIEHQEEKEELRKRWLIVFCDALDEMRCSDAAVSRLLAKLRENRTLVSRKRNMLSAARISLSTPPDTLAAETWVSRLRALIGARARWEDIKAVLEARVEGVDSDLDLRPGDGVFALLERLGADERFLANGDREGYLTSKRQRAERQVRELELWLQNPPPTCFLDITGVTRTEGGKRRWGHASVMASCRPEWLRHFRMVPADIIGDEEGEAWWIEPFGDEEIDNYIGRVASYHPNARIPVIRSRLELLKHQKIRPMREIGFGDRVEVVQRGTSHVRDVGTVIRAQFTAGTVPYYVVRTSQGTSKFPADTVRHVETSLLQVPFLLCLAMNAVVPCSLADNVLDSVTREMGLGEVPGLWELYEAALRVHFSRKLQSVGSVLKGWTAEMLMSYAMWAAVRLYLDGCKWHSTIGDLRELLRDEYEMYPPSLPEREQSMAENQAARNPQASPDLPSVVWALVGTLPLRADSYERGDAQASFRQKTLHEFLIARCLFERYTAGARVAARQQIFARGLLNQPQVIRFVHDRISRDADSQRDAGQRTLVGLIQRLAAAAGEDAATLSRAVLCTALHLWGEAEAAASANAFTVAAELLKTKALLQPAPHTIGFGGVEDSFLASPDQWPRSVPLASQCGCGARDLIPDDEELSKLARKGDDSLHRLAGKHKIALNREGTLSISWALTQSQQQSVLAALVAHRGRNNPQRWPVLRPGLEELRLRRVGASPADIGGLFASYRHQGHLTELDLSGNALGDAGAAALQPVLRTCALRSLRLSANRFTDTGVRQIARALGAPTALTSLDLSDNLVVSCIPDLLNVCYRLVEVDFGRHLSAAASGMTTSATVSGVGEWMRLQSSVPELRAALHQALELRDIGFAGQDVDAGDAAVLLAGLSQKSAVRNIDLRHSQHCSPSSVAALFLSMHAARCRNAVDVSVDLRGTWVGSLCVDTAGLMTVLLEKAVGRGTGAQRAAEQTLHEIVARAPEMAYAVPAWIPHCGGPSSGDQRLSLLRSLQASQDHHQVLPRLLSFDSTGAGGWRQAFWVWKYAMASVVVSLAAPADDGPPVIVPDPCDWGMRVCELNQLRDAIWSKLLAASPKAALSTPDSALHGVAACVATMYALCPSLALVVLQNSEYVLGGKDVLGALARAWPTTLGDWAPPSPPPEITSTRFEGRGHPTLIGKCWAGTYRLSGKCDGRCAKVLDTDGKVTPEELPTDADGTPVAKVVQRWGDLLFLSRVHGPRTAVLNVRAVSAVHFQADGSGHSSDEESPSSPHAEIPGGCWVLVKGSLPTNLCADHVCSPQRPHR